jgi:zinc-finger-containing domain
MTAPICDYCGNPAKMVSGAEIYAHRADLSEKIFWQCKPCDAYVGTHANSADHIALGRLANFELRRAKNAAHSAFDPMWKGGSVNRKTAYSWLSKTLGIKASLCHIGMFDVDQCKAVVKACAAMKEQQS